MKILLKILIVIILASVGSILVVGLSSYVLVLTGSVVAKWLVYAILMVPFLYVMGNLGKFLGKA